MDPKGLMHGRPTYATTDGRSLSRIDARHFRLQATGEVFERIG